MVRFHDASSFFNATISHNSIIQYHVYAKRNKIIEYTYNCNALKCKNRYNDNIVQHNFRYSIINNSRQNKSIIACNKFSRDITR